MSIPDRFFRIARHKLSEIKDRIDKWDEQAQENREADQKRRQSEYRNDAHRELDDAMHMPPANAGGTSSSGTAAPQRRAPEEIARGSRPLPAAAPPPAHSAPAGSPATAANDLRYHYGLLGIEPGSDFTAVQAAYNKLAARSDPSRFPAGSDEEAKAKEIRQRLDASYRALRERLDPTARRFDLLEFDAPKPPEGDQPPTRKIEF